MKKNNIASQWLSFLISSATGSLPFHFVSNGSGTLIRYEAPSFCLHKAIKLPCGNDISPLIFSISPKSIIKSDLRLSFSYITIPLQPLDRVIIENDALLPEQTSFAPATRSRYGRLESGKYNIKPGG